MEQPVKWGVLSVSGHFAKRLASVLNESPSVELHSIASRDLQRAVKAARDWGFSKAYGDYQSLLENPGIQAVYLPLPNHLHTTWIEKSLRAGKHVLCEKPMALKAQDILRVQTIAEEEGLLLREACMYPYHRQWQKVRSLLDQSAIGEVQSIHCHFSYNNRDPKNIRNKRDCGGGALYDIGYYAVSCCRFILKQEPWRVIGISEIDEDWKIDRLSSGILEYPGCHCTFTVGTQSFPCQRVEITGSNGHITIERPFNAWTDQDNWIEIETARESERINCGRGNQYLAMFEDFNSSIRSEAFPEEPIDAYHNQATLDLLLGSESLR